MAASETMRKITISLPEELVEFADDHAKALHTSRSQVIGLALAAVKTKAEEHLAADGYRFYAQEASEFADALSAAAAEAWSDAWLEPQGDGPRSERCYAPTWGKGAGGEGADSEDMENGQRQTHPASLPELYGKFPRSARYPDHLARGEVGVK